MTSSMPHTPGGISVLATPAMTPALAPEAGDFLSGKGGGGGDPNGAGPPPRTPQSFAGYHISKPIPQPSVTGAPSLLVTDATGSSSKPTSPLNFTGNGWDYFSTAQDRNRTGSESAPATTMAVDLQTPGGSFMGKFKGFGKGKKPTPGLVTPAPVAEISEEDVKRQADLEKVSTGCVSGHAWSIADWSPFARSKWGPLSDRDLYQRRVLEAIRSRPLVPPNPKDIPSIPSFADAAIFIDEESKDAGAFAVIYRGGASTTGVDKEVLEMALPVWVLEFLLAGRAPMRDPIKISFLLEPWDKNGGGLMEMPNG
jgi:WD repeat-containing protein 48